MRVRSKSVAWGVGVALGVLVLAACADPFAAHGLDAQWRQVVGGKLVTIDRTLEHRTAFPNQHRPLSRYIQAWPFDQQGVPSHLPELDARLTATLGVPPGPTRSLRAVSQDRVRLFVDGRELDRRLEPIAPGPHDLEVYWSGRFDDHTGLRLEWTSPDGGFVPVPDTALTPREAPWPPLRIGLWAGAGLLALLLGWLAAFAAAGATVPARRRRWGAFAIVAAVLLTVGYRSFDYSVMPDFRENYDELFATWNGWSLLEEGTPRGWSLWPGRYFGRSDVKITPLRYFSPRPFSVVVPYFEHPPLLHLMVGATAIAGGASNWAYARLEHTRIVPIVLSALTVWLLMLVARRLDPKGPGPWLGGLLYAVLPIIALQGRVIKEEALVAPMALLSLLLYLRWRDDGERTSALAAAAAVAGAATLAKAPGLVFLVALVALLLERRRPREAAIAAGVGLLATTPLLAYAAAIDWGLFWRVTLHQATGRPSHFNLYPRFFDDPLINHNLVGRPWLLFLWLGWALALRGFRPKDRAVLVLPPLLYILGMGLSSGNWTFGWYMMPVYPFLCIGAGRFLADLWDRPTLLAGTLLMTLGVMYGVNFLREPKLWREASAWDHTRHMVTVFLVVSLAPYALAQISRARAVRTLARAATAAGLAAMVVLSGYFVVHYDAIYETHRNFDRVEFFDR